MTWQQTTLFLSHADRRLFRSLTFLVVLPLLNLGHLPASHAADKEAHPQRHHQHLTYRAQDLGPDRDLVRGRGP